MPAATRVGDTDTGHDACPPTALSSGSPNVNVNGIPVGRVGDPYIPHGCPAHIPHVGNIASGAPHVFINGLATGRIGDPVTCGGSVAAGSPNVFVGNGGGDSLTVNGQAVSPLDFKCKCVGDVVQQSPLFTDVDEIILATPDICKNMANNSIGFDSEAWSELARLLKIWITGQEYVLTNVYIENGQAPIVEWSLDWDWYLSYQRTKSAYEELVSRALSSAGESLLAQRLQRMPEYSSGRDFVFDFSQKPSSEWQQWYINSYKMEKSPQYGADGINVVLSSHMIKVLPAGSVYFNEDGTKTIEVNKLYAYVQDLFNFESDFLYDNLGFWSKKEKLFKHTDIMFSPSSWNSYYNLDSDKFNVFRKKYGRGQDFILHSELRECSEFAPWSYTIE